MSAIVLDCSWQIGRYRSNLSKVTLAIGLMLGLSSAYADLVKVAVAANLAQTADQLAKRFESISPHRVELQVASTGQLFHQIRMGAPFDHFIAADRARPEQLDAEQRILANSRQTYALGQLLWVQTQPFNPQEIRMPRLPRRDEKVTDFETTGLMLDRVGMANPAFAPFGIAAKTFLEHNNIVPKKIVETENVAQAWHKLLTRQVDAALVSVAQYKRYQAQSLRQGVVRNRLRPLYARPIPTSMYGAIEQQAAVVRSSVATQRWHDFILGAEGQRILQAFGYLPADTIDEFKTATSHQEQTPKETKPN